MLKIAITGNIACGKSLAFNFIKKLGYPVIDCDDIIKDLYSKTSVITDISKKFPYLVNNNSINLRVLSKMIFSDKKFKKDFENIIFPLVKNEILKFFNDFNDKKKVFVIVPLLFESGFDKLFDIIIFISASEDTRLKRLTERNSRLSILAKDVIKAQMPEEVKIKKSDYVIVNNDTIEKFKNDIKNVIELLD